MWSTIVISQPASTVIDRRHGGDHDRGLARVDGVLDQPVEPAFEACLVVHHVEVRTRGGQSCRGSDRRVDPELSRSVSVTDPCVASPSPPVSSGRASRSSSGGSSATRSTPRSPACIWPFLGLLFLPWTTLAYVLAWGPVYGVSGFWGWLVVALGLMPTSRRTRPARPKRATRPSARRPARGRGRRRRGVRRRAPSTTRSTPSCRKPARSRELSAATFSGATNTCTRPRPSVGERPVRQRHERLGRDPAAARGRARGRSRARRPGARRAPASSRPGRHRSRGRRSTRWSRLPSRRHSS